MKIDLRQKRKNFTIISNVIAKDINISLKAKGMSLVIAHFPSDWVFYEENLQNYTNDGKTAISNALRELEVSGYLYREQLREKGRFSNKIWIFNDEKLNSDDLEEFTVIRKTDVGKNDSGKSPTTNTHSNQTKECNKKNTQKKGRKKVYFEFVNVLKMNAMEYPNLKILFEENTYVFVNINGKFLLKDETNNMVLSTIYASKLYQKMANSAEVQIVRGEK